MSTAVPFRDRHRATKYQPKYALPPNFAQILKDFTREVLREQPADIVAWSAVYFKRMALESDPLQPQQPPQAHYEPVVENPELEVVAMKIAKVFQSMDDGNTGYLYVHLVKRALLDALTLTKPQALYILSSENVKLNDDGMLSYQEFARECVQPVLFFQETKYEFQEVRHVDDELTVHGMVKTELQDELLRVMRKADEKEHLGRLTFAQYRAALYSAPLQLTQRDINVLCAEAEQTSDGFIDFRNEVENAFLLLYLSQSFTAFDEQQM